MAENGDGRIRDPMGEQGDTVRTLSPKKEVGKRNAAIIENVDMYRGKLLNSKNNQVPIGSAQPYNPTTVAEIHRLATEPNNDLVEYWRRSGLDIWGTKYDAAAEENEPTMHCLPMVTTRNVSGDYCSQSKKKRSDATSRFSAMRCALGKSFREMKGAQNGRTVGLMWEKECVRCDLVMFFVRPEYYIGLQIKMGTRHPTFLTKFGIYDPPSAFACSIDDVSRCSS